MKSFNFNPITLIDGYKLDHRRQYPLGTTRVNSNWTPRSSRVPGVNFLVLFGLRYFLQRYLMEEMARFFNESRERVKERYYRRVKGYLGPDAATAIGTDHIHALWNLAHIPLEFRAAPEGTKIPLRVPAITVENTHDDFFWLPNYIETQMSCSLWLPSTSATTAYCTRKMLDAKAQLTGGPAAFVPWQGHDFSYRGMGGLEAAMMSGAGHLLSFTGTDTIPALDFIEHYYGPIPSDALVGGSVAATEHSVMCAGSEEGEQATIERLLNLYPTGVLSVVSDTWDLWQVLDTYLPALKEQIMLREGKLVIRPDSGDPVKILCGDPDKDGTARLGVIKALWDTFGGTENAHGFKELDPHIGSIYGDSINYERAEQICDGLARKGFASTNVVFGNGSFTYQFVTRDTYGLAMKATWVKIDGEGRNIFKSPKTDDGTKNSAKGRLAVLEQNGTLVCVNECTPEQEARSLLQPVWKNGDFVTHRAADDFLSIRRRLHP